MPGSSGLVRMLQMLKGCFACFVPRAATLLHALILPQGARQAAWGCAASEEEE